MRQPQENPLQNDDKEAKRKIFCPDCGASDSDVRRSHREGFLERIASPLTLPFRCKPCGNRFFVWFARSSGFTGDDRA
jgi:DNA-directed RNA polymerase subunit RPC12/RpoP